MGDAMRKGKGPLPRQHYRLVAGLGRAWPGGGREREPVIAAVSGGSDSMALLELLSLWATERGPQVTACYIDHGMRRTASREAAFVAASAARLGFDFETRRISDPGRGDEDHLRRCRYRLLTELAGARGARWIVTGHTRDDQIETILFRFLRGAGLGGLGGIRQRRGPLLRPLLAESREVLRTFLRDRGVGWLEDPSNTDMRYARNRMRHLVVPLLESSFGQGALAHLPAVARRWRCDEEYLDAEARRFAGFALRGHGRGSELDLVAVTGVPEALRARVLRIWIATAGGPDPPTIAQLERVEAIALNAPGPASVDLPGLTVLRRKGLLCRAGAAPEKAAAAHGNSGADRVQRRAAPLRARRAAKR